MMRDPLVSIGGGIAAAIGARALLSHIGGKHLKQLPSVRGTPSIVGDVNKDYGVNVGYQHSPSIGGRNAFFIRKEELNKALDNPELHGFDAKQIVRMIRKAKQHGLVITGKGFNKPGVIEHELGHAIATHKGTPWEKFTHGPWSDVLSAAGGTAGLSGALIAGASVPGIKGKLLGMGLGGGLSGLFNVPMISRELTANRYGKELMDPEMAAKVKNWPFVGTYVNAAVTLPAVTGLLAGQPRHNYYGELRTLAQQVRAARKGLSPSLP